MKKATLRYIISNPLKWYRERKEERRSEILKHNKRIIKELHEDVWNTIASGYWNGDITQYMKGELFGMPNGRITRLFYDAIRKLKK